ncbi:MAG: FAD-dependent monooxygenase [Anaerolineales bacterium]
MAPPQKDIFTDVLILGSGPAGLSTALHLQQINPAWTERMILLEKAAHPRPKLCGGGVTRLGLNSLLELGLRLPLPVEGFAVHDVNLRYKTKLIQIKGNPQFMVYHRPSFDAYLASQARQRGIDLRENEPAREILIVNEEVQVLTKTSVYHTKVLVAADGANGITRRMFKTAHNRAHIGRTLELLQPASKDNPLFSQNQANFDFFCLSDRNQGYIWDFPLLIQGNPVHNRGVYDSRTITSAPRANLPHLLGQAYKEENDPFVFQSHPIHWFSPFNLLAKPRLIFVGDAAGVDPLFGEGIGPALAYGSVAAQSIVQAFQSGDFSMSFYPQKLFTSYLGRYLLIRWAAAHFVYLLGRYDGFASSLWTIGAIIAKLFPPPPRLPE